MKGQIFIQMVTHVIAVNFETTEELDTMVKYFNEHSDKFKPVAQVVALGVAGAVLDATDPQGPGRPPLCEIHHRPMKPSQRDGGWYCSSKMQDGTWCKQKVK